MTARLRSALAVAGLLALAACGAEAPAEAPDATRQGERAPGAQNPESPEPETEGLPEGAEDLRDLVEAELEKTPEVPVADGPLFGGDVSWPQCPKGMGIPEKQSLGIPMPLPEARFVIIGLTNGPAFTPNPCLADQVAWVRDRGLLGAAYAVNSYPDAATLARYRDRGPYDGSDRLGALRNVGYQQARYNIANMVEAGLPSPIIWLDVEPVPVFEWSDDKVANAAVVEGAARGYTDAGYDIGFYSTQFLWDTVVGDFALGAPEWRAAGQTSQAEAISRCDEASSFQGGDALIGQWVADNRDLNITCPGVEDRILGYFHQF